MCVCMFVCVYVCVYLYGEKGVRASSLLQSDHHGILQSTITLHCTLLHYVALHHITFNYITLHCITLHYIAQQYITSSNVFAFCCHTLLHVMLLHISNITYSRFFFMIYPYRTKSKNSILRINEFKTKYRPIILFFLFS